MQEQKLSTDVLRTVVDRVRLLVEGIDDPAERAKMIETYLKNPSLALKKLQQLSNKEEMEMANNTEETLVATPEEDGNWYDRKGVLYDFLKEHNFTKVVIEFSGSGDDGDIESIYFMTKAEDGSSQVVDYDEKNPLLLEETDIYDVLKEFGYLILNMSGYDWVNNEGGYGTIAVEVEERKTHLDMNIAYTHYNNYEEEY